MISFDNTEIAFKSKSPAALRRAYYLFKIIGNPTFVRIGKWLTITALNLRLPINGMIKKTIFKQFCGGETIEECKPTIETLNSFKIGTILDYSVEGKTNSKDFENTTRELISTIETAKNNPAIPFAVFKCTGICRFSLLEKMNDINYSFSKEEQDEKDVFLERIERICHSAFVNQVPLFVDAEETWIQDAIDRVVWEMMLKYNQAKAIVFNTLQMYRHDRIAYLETQIEAARANNIHYGIKLVRGAYMEKERERALEKGYASPIQKDKKATDLDYDLALKMIIENLDVLALCAGTHNEESSLFLSNLLTEYKVPKEDKRVYFAQLLGMSDHISYNLSNDSYNVAKYVPYGPVREVMPYLLRRADENTSVAGQTSRELSLITKEINRRKQQKY